MEMKSAASDSRTKNTQQPPQPAPVSRAPSAPHFCERKCERRQPRSRQVSSTRCDRHSIFCGAPCRWRGTRARHGLAAGRLSAGAAHSLRDRSSCTSPPATKPDLGSLHQLLQLRSTTIVLPGAARMASIHQSPQLFGLALSVQVSAFTHRLKSVDAGRLLRHTQGHTQGCTQGHPQGCR